MIFGIPSYHRPECKTYKYLRSIGVPDSDILIGLNDPTDSDEYSKRMPDARFVVKRGGSAAFNRNTLISSIGDQCVLLDDDITNIKIVDVKPDMKYGKAEKVEVKQLLQILSDCFYYSEKINADIFGFSPTGNCMIITQRIRSWGNYTPDTMIQGTVTGIVNPNVRFNEKYLMVEDYEISCRIIAKGRHTLRRNDMFAEKAKNGTNSGGLHERYANGEQPYWIDRLCNQYSKIIAPNKEKTGVRVII